MPENRILEKMLDRLHTALLRGAALNCRPHSSRQRIDLRSLDAFGDVPPSRILPALLGEGRSCTVTAAVPMPPELADVPYNERFEKRFVKEDEPEATPAVRAWRKQKTILTKVRHLSEDARNYEQDTGVGAMSIGYPVLSLPPSGAGGRILAPVAFIQTTLDVQTGRKPGVSITCREQGADLVVPNVALLVWIEKQLGIAPPEMFEDEEGKQPWAEIGHLIDHVCKALGVTLDPAASFTDPENFALEVLPLMEDLPAGPALLRSAVMGLFPAANQGLLRDTKAMIAAETLAGPVTHFVDAKSSLEAADYEAPDPGVGIEKQSRRFEQERLISQCDPCQTRTVELARTSAALVVHGPPGTGKSQTITNIIGDHLARGERVLFVCDKRTALDVVANRLEHLGLGRFCATVHDPARDQRDFYLFVRQRLEELAEVQTAPRAEAAIAKIDAELTQIHGELTANHRELMKSEGEGESFHELAGAWLELVDSGVTPVEPERLGGLTLADLQDRQSQIELVLRRAAEVGYANHPWQPCVGMSLDDFMARPMARIRQQFASCVEHARAADGTIAAEIPPFDAATPLEEQARRRTELEKVLRELGGGAADDIPARSAAMADDAVKRMIQELSGLQPQLDVLGRGPMDAELAMAARQPAMPLAAINASIADLQRYRQSAGSILGVLAFSAKKAAGRALSPFGLIRTTENAERLIKFLEGLRARLILTGFLARTEGVSPAPAWPFDDATLSNRLGRYRLALTALSIGAGDRSLEKVVRAAVPDGAARATQIAGLTASPARAESLITLEAAMAGLKLFNDLWLSRVSHHARQGRKVTETLARLEQTLDSLEPVVRVAEELRRLPGALAAVVRDVIESAEDAEQGVRSLMAAVLHGEVLRRIEASENLRRFDGDRLRHLFERYEQLDAKKRDLVRDVIVHKWVERQKQRLLVGTESRLNSVGAALRRRLYVKGQKAMRLRQMIAVGAGIEGGDPLFDMCPVWMASPETVAQVLPAEPLFDVAIFDEASQCRLEEALPVLLRARRVVIAGDPKQLPPTRFFEAAVASSEPDELETEQDVFVAQQGEVEDLLAAALNLEVHESYLDVHYRSRNADLIEFSNRSFYHDRLQAIPGHPSHRARQAPIRLERAGGLYEERANPIEAKRVCEIVAELLKRAEPPSIGIATFNLPQRDLILDMLDEQASEDDAFAARLARARQRRGAGSFEGLFVKNLESVQGDERDHMIISTTYGPDAKGKFAKRFGPLLSAGGGRRLNVLVTRARREVHLVTSIPREAYLSADELPKGATPNGGWLLFSYLRYAEELAELYEKDEPGQEEPAEGAGAARLVERAIDPPSRFAHRLGNRLLREKGIGSDVHWGNRGFCIDAALHHPNRPHDVTLGVLCDFNRFPDSADPVEWEVFRSAVLRGQGWRLHRLWTPQFVRDPEGTMGRIAAEALRIAAEPVADADV